MGRRRDYEEELEDEELEEAEEIEPDDEEPAEDEEADYDEEDGYDEPPPSNLSTYLKLGVPLVLSAVAVGLIISSGRSKGAQSDTKKAAPPPPIVSQQVEQQYPPGQWVVTMDERGAYRINGKKIMANWTLKDESNNVFFLTAEEKRDISKAMDAFDAQRKK